MKPVEQCVRCGSDDLTWKVYRHTEKVGQYNLVDQTTLAWQCSKCGTAQLTLDQLQTYQIVAAKTALCDGKHEGAVIRYARKALGVTQKELGQLLDYQPETISKWENNKEPFQRAAVNALVGVLLRAIDGEQLEDMLEKARPSSTTPAESTSNEIVVRQVIPLRISRTSAPAESTNDESPLPRKVG